MTGEAVVQNLLELPIDYTVADGTVIEKGTWCKLTDPQTASANDTLGAACAGILYEEKIASDGRTRAPLLKRGRVKALLSGSATAGDMLMMEGNDNQLIVANTSGNHVVAIAEETGTDGETIFVYFDTALGVIRY